MFLSRWLGNNCELKTIKPCYEDISNSFINHYYQIWDNDFLSLNKLLANNIKISYFNNKFGDFLSWVNFIKNKQGVCNFKHIQFKTTSQPLNNNIVLIQVVGTITVNDSIYWRNFTETIIIQQDIWDKWYITNIIFSLV